MFNQAKQPFSLEVFRPASIYRKSARLSQAEEEAARSLQGSKPCPEPWAFCQDLLFLSHGQVSVERGFSMNEEMEACDM
ncbi:hypothetical protein MHYP_G00193140 [Metynnis hypsauchen]